MAEGVDRTSTAAQRHPWLHRRSWVRPGSPLWAVLLLLDAVDWLAMQTAKLMGWRP